MIDSAVGWLLLFVVGRRLLYQMEVVIIIFSDLLDTEPLGWAKRCLVVRWLLEVAWLAWTLGRLCCTVILAMTDAISRQSHSVNLSVIP